LANFVLPLKVEIAKFYLFKRYKYANSTFSNNSVDVEHLEEFVRHFDPHLSVKGRAGGLNHHDKAAASETLVHQTTLSLKKIDSLHNLTSRPTQP